MLVRKIIVWLNWAFQYSNAGEYFLMVNHVADSKSNSVSFQVIIPQQEFPGIQSQDPFARWYSNDPTIVKYRRAHPEKGRDYTPTLLNSNVIKDGIAFIKGRLVIFKWKSQFTAPMMDVLSESDLPFLRNMKFHHVVPAVEGTSFGLMTVNIKVDDHTLFYGDVSFDYAYFHSLFPEEAFTILEDAFRAIMNEPLTNAFDCPRLRNLALPKFEFQIAGKKQFTLTTPNYYVQSKLDKKCYMAVRVNPKKNKWVIGAALAKTHETVFRIRYIPRSQFYEYNIFKFAQ